MTLDLAAAVLGVLFLLAFIAERILSYRRLKQRDRDAEERRRNIVIRPWREDPPDDPPQGDH